MLKKFGFIILLMFAGLSWGQQLSVTATITDSDGQTWNNGTWSVALACPANACYYNGTVISNVPQTGVLSSSGALAVTLYNSSTITPSGATYNWILCSQTSAPCSAFQSPVTSANLSSLLSSLVSVPRFGAGPTAKGYLDVEVNTVPFVGATYFNVTSQATKTWNGSAWVTSSGGGSPTGAAGGALAGTYPNPTLALTQAENISWSVPATGAAIATYQNTSLNGLAGIAYVDNTGTSQGFVGYANGGFGIDPGAWQITTASAVIAFATGYTERGRIYTGWMIGSGLTDPGAGNLNIAGVTATTASTIASATTIAPVTNIVTISGTAAISSITPATTVANYCFDILASGTWTTVAGASANNTANALTAVSGTMYRACRMTDNLWHIK